jgi:K+-transporting ATPase ATPase A chain
MSVFYIILITGISALLSYPLARAMTCVMEPEETGSTWRFRVEKGLKNICGDCLSIGQNWKQYAVSMLVFSGVMFVGICLVLTLQHVLPLNPDGKGPLSLDLIFHTAASFVTNTNLQHYSGEVSLSYFSQIFGLMTMQFLSAGTGIAVFEIGRAHV